MRAVKLVWRLHCDNLDVDAISYDALLDLSGSNQKMLLCITIRIILYSTIKIDCAWMLCQRICIMVVYKADWLKFPTLLYIVAFVDLTFLLTQLGDTAALFLSCSKKRL